MCMLDKRWVAHLRHFPQLFPQCMLGSPPPPRPWVKISGYRKWTICHRWERMEMQEPWPSHTNHTCFFWRPFWWLNWFVGWLLKAATTPRLVWCPLRDNIFPNNSRWQRVLCCVHCCCGILINLVLCLKHWSVTLTRPYKSKLIQSLS